MTPGARRSVELHNEGFDGTGVIVTGGGVPLHFTPAGRLQMKLRGELQLTLYQYPGGTESDAELETAMQFALYVADRSILL